ncbi:MAG: MFS transporter [Bacteroidota bacterium]
MITKSQINNFLKYNSSLLGFGFLMAFFSSFGQTFLLSLYLPPIESFLGLTNTELGSIYAIATIGSALTLPWLGGFFDKKDIKYYSLFVILGLFFSLLILSFSYYVVMVIIGFYGLRLFGQGLMTHTSVSAMARYFSSNRGKAIGAASLGHPAGEALLPILIALLISATGWRGALQISAISCIVLIVPLAMILLYRSKSKIKAYNIQARKESKNDQKTINIWHIIKTKNFWIISPVIFMVGFTNTAIFFFQLKLGDIKGWSPEWVAGSISAFAIAGAVGMLGIGSFIDRFTGKRLFPFYMIPYVAGLLILVYFDQPLAYPIALAFAGLASGAGRTIKDSMLAEIYGVKIIGQIRSIFTTVMVISTAIGPVVFGIMLDLNIGFSEIFASVIIAMTLFVINGLRRLQTEGEY